MRVWHAVKTSEKRDDLERSNLIPLGHNVGSDQLFAHVSLKPFRAGSYALDVIGADTNEAWVFELEIANDTSLVEDPSDEGQWYGGGWKVSETPIQVLKICQVTHIEHVQNWKETAFQK